MTSANRHGEPPGRTPEEVLAAFGRSDGPATPPSGPTLALVVDGGRCDGVPSTVADCTVSPPVCRRQGAVPWAWVEAALR